MATLIIMIAAQMSSIRIKSKHPSLAIVLGQRQVIQRHVTTAIPPMILTATGQYIQDREVGNTTLIVTEIKLTSKKILGKPKPEKKKGLFILSSLFYLFRRKSKWLIQLYFINTVIGFKKLTNPF
ncbi:MAG TPA: hypothetical protein VNJ07_08165 [Chitinophagales bacterium]|nr:hypothetical protein [Chitinophagales bacterium]